MDVTDTESDGATFAGGPVGPAETGEGVEEAEVAVTVEDGSEVEGGEEVAVTDPAESGVEGLVEEEEERVVGELEVGVVKENAKVAVEVTAELDEELEEEGVVGELEGGADET